MQCDRRHCTPKPACRHLWSPYYEPLRHRTVSSTRKLFGPRIKTYKCDAIENEVHEALAICEGGAVAALRIYAFLKAEIDRLSAAVSSGLRGKVRKAPLAKEAKEKKYPLTMS
jgi:hypothetical protein